MISFLFWNLMGNQQNTWLHRAPRLCTSITRLVTSLKVDVLMFAESGFQPMEIVTALSQAGLGVAYQASPTATRIQVFSRVPEINLIPQFDSVDERLTVRRLRTTKTEFLLAVVHFQSQLHGMDAVAQALQATTLRDNIVRAEQTVGHERTILVGDLNMNPFDPGVVGAQALHAMMTREQTGPEERTVSSQPYRMFYNPMWGCFGDRTHGPPGTYYYSSSSPVSYGWNIFDQVLLRPSVMDHMGDLKILDSDGVESFVTTRGRPRNGDFSDHLPLLFRLDH